VWVSTDNRRVLRLNPTTNRVDARVMVGASAGVLAPTDAAVWVTAPQARDVVRIDPVTNAVVARIPVGTEAACPSWVTADAASAWVVLYTLGVARIDAATNTVAAQTPGSQARACQPASVALAGGRLWSLDALTGALFGLDPTSLTTMTTGQLGAGNWQVAGNGATLWALDQSRGRLVRIDPTDGSIIKRVSTRSDRASQLVLGADSVWFYDGKSIVRVPYRSEASRTHIEVSKVNGFALSR
jgi:streptogramin lyase